MILETDLSRHYELVCRFRTRAVNLHDFSFENLDDKIIILAMGLKVADLGHAAKIYDIHEK